MKPWVAVGVLLGMAISVALVAESARPPGQVTEVRAPLSEEQPVVEPLSPEGCQQFHGFYLIEGLACFSSKGETFTKGLVQHGTLPHWVHVQQSRFEGLNQVGSSEYVFRLPFKIASSNCHRSGPNEGTLEGSMRFSPMTFRFDKPRRAPQRLPLKWEDGTTEAIPALASGLDLGAVASPGFSYGASFVLTAKGSLFIKLPIQRGKDDCFLHLVHMPGMDSMDPPSGDGT